MNITEQWIAGERGWYADVKNAYVHEYSRVMLEDPDGYDSPNRLVVRFSYHEAGVKTVVYVENPAYDVGVSLFNIRTVAQLTALVGLLCR